MSNDARSQEGPGRQANAEDGKAGPLQPKALKIRCPHCHNPVEVVDDDPLADLECPSCGSHFHLISGQSTVTGDVGGMKTIGRFRLIERVGVGHFGSVWKARDSELDRMVAVKIPRQDQLDAAGAEQFMREARAAAQVKHPNIVGVHEVGREGDSLYIVSDFVEGADLKDWLTGQRLTPHEAAALCLKVADALHAAHEAGVVHRDLKPGNIMLGVDGEPHITDFGLAKREVGEITMTVEGRVLGTPAYMSPEQARGEAHHADRRSDVYSLGVILYQLLSGELPFRGSERMLIVQILKDEPPSPRKLNANVPRDLETVCLKCLEKEPRKRYPTTKDLADELRRWLRGEPILARPITRAARAWRWCRRNPVVPILGAVMLLAIALTVVTGAFFWVRRARDQALEAEGVAVAEKGEADRQRKIVEKNEKRAVELKEEADRQRKIAERKQQDAIQAKERGDIARKDAEKARQKEEYGAYIGRIGLAAAKIEENAFDRALEVLNECPLPLRDWEWGRLMYLCTQNVRTFDAQQPIDTVAFSPDGKRLITGGWGDTARIWNAESGEELVAISTGGQHVFAVAFSPDGKHVATGTNDRPNYVKIWDSETGALVRALPGHKDAVLCVVYSRDGKRLLTSSYDNTAMLWDLEDLQTPLLKTFRGHDWWVWWAAFSPDEKRIVTASQDGYARVWSVETGEPGPPFRGHAGPVYAAAFSPDGKYVATAGYDKRILLWQPDKVKSFDFETLAIEEGPAPHVLETVVRHMGGVCSVQFSADGNLLLSGSNDNTVRVWDVATRKLLKTLRGHGGRVRSCVFSPDGHWVLSGSHDHQAKIWSLAGYEEARVFQGRVLEGHRDAILGAAFSPDGERIVSASRDRTAKTWDVNKGRQIREFKEGHDFLATTAVFFPDGKKVLTAAVDNTTRIWDVATGTQLSAIKGTGSSAVVVLSHDAKWILTGSDDRTAKLWDAKTWNLLRTLERHRAEVTAVAISPDNSLLFTGDGNGQCRLWDAKTGEEKWRSDERVGGHSRGITAAFFLPNGERVLTASADNTVGQWDVKTGREELSLILKHPDAVTSMALSPNGQRALTTCAENTVRLWDVESGKEIGKLATGDAMINSVAFSPDGQRALTTGSDNSLRLWDLQAFREINAGEGGPLVDLEAAGGLAWSVVFSPDGAYVLTVGGNDARLWDVKTGREHMRFSPQDAVASADFSPDGKRIVTGSWDNTARIWNARTGIAELKLAGGHTGYVNGAVFSPDGNKVLTASDDKTAVLWDAKTGEMLLTFSGHVERVRSAVFSSDGRRVLTASNDKTARIWDARTGEQLLVLKGHKRAVLDAAFSADGNRVITGSEDNSAKLWDAATGEQLPFSNKGLGLTGHSAGVTSVGFSPDGKRVITGSRDTTAKVWELISGEEILTLKGHSEEVTSVAFSPEGRSVLSGSRDGTLILWLAVDWQQQ